MAVLAVCTAVPAHAASIVNLSDKPKDLELTVAGQRQTIHLEPGAVWQSQARPIYAELGEHRLILDHFTEYAYWPDGTLMPQLRQTYDMGVGGR